MCGNIHVFNNMTAGTFFQFSVNFNFIFHEACTRNDVEAFPSRTGNLSWLSGTFLKRVLGRILENPSFFHSK